MLGLTLFKDRLDLVKELKSIDGERLFRTGATCCTNNFYNNC